MQIPHLLQYVDTENISDFVRKMQSVLLTVRLSMGMLILHSICKIYYSDLHLPLLLQQ